MKLIRNNVFETNSSSCHSISVSEGTELNSIPVPDGDGNIHIHSGEFGWEIESHYDFGSKAAYLAIYCRDWVGDDKDKYKEIFESVIKEVTQCEEITYEDKFWDFEERSYPKTNYVDGKRVETGEVVKYKSSLGEGHIDHQSVDSRDLDEFFEDTAQMKQLLFNSASYIQTDNDNH